MYRRRNPGEYFRVASKIIREQPRRVLLALQPPSKNLSAFIFIWTFEKTASRRSVFIVLQTFSKCIFEIYFASWKETSSARIALTYLS